MKKTVIFILLFFSILVGVKAYALDKSYRYVWKDTYVDIPLYSDLDDYRYIPKASLYIDGILKTDSNITINSEGDWLYLLDDVDVNKIGEYKVWYKASESKYQPGTCSGYKSLITFNVVDSIKPQIFQLENSISFQQGASITENDLKKFFKVEDNYSKSLEYKFNGISFDTSICGTYKASLTVIDESLNKETLDFNITIYNKEAPKIVFTGLNNKLSIQVNEQIDIKSYFIITDDYDEDIEKNANFPIIYTSKIQKYNYTVSATDSSGTCTSLTIIVEVVDDILPVIELYQYEKTENYLAYKSINFSSYIKSLTDNNELLDNSLVNYSSNLEGNVGKYYVYYEYVDEGNNKAVVTLTINLVSFKAPKITVDNSKTTIKQGQSMDLDDIVYVTDDSDILVSESLVINGSVNINEVGTYTLEAYAINSSGVSTTKEFYIYVIEDNAIIGIFQSDNYVYAIILGIGILSTIGLIYYLKKIKYKNNN